jgi:hypothetical protein
VLVLDEADESLVVEVEVEEEPHAARPAMRAIAALPVMKFLRVRLFEFM